MNCCEPSPLVQYPAASELSRLQSDMKSTSLRQLFATDHSRFDRYSLEAAGLFLDYSKHWINDEVLNALVGMAEQSGMETVRDAMFRGEKINRSEDRAVLHTALRYFGSGSIYVDGKDVMPVIRKARAQMKKITEEVHSGCWTGFSGKPVRHIVNLGIGGSYLGLKTVTNALTPFREKGLEHHYVANIDPSELSEVLKKVDAESTLFIVASKSFGTKETLSNAQSARRWMIEQGCPDNDIRKHFVAISTNLSAIDQFGIDHENTLPLWDWVGGRYSLWSTIGLMISLVVGYDNFERLLKGAARMDQHFREAPLNSNMPVIMGLLGVWYQNWFGAQTHAVVSYDYFLRNLPGHLQQLDMESNGKQMTNDGRLVNCQTGPIIWGGTGTNDQHAYHQLLHQGTRLIPVDFITTATSYNPMGDQHIWLFANALAQSQAMMQGKNLDEVKAELAAAGMNPEAIEKRAPHKVIPGNRPNSVIVTESIAPETLGALIALYEHKVFVQGHLWGINSFDQWGVELGKVLSNTVFDRLASADETLDQDVSTNGLIQKFRCYNH
ncbi:Glucose-6-phosphate isomerase [invertebrate metagenome]|uniref:glucose-6-phosphate isomerase n=1 Tax=invertebrate metagenome TaxID=1711999 RepID=A0A2H9T9A3_9ZZZZ